MMNSLPAAIHPTKPAISAILPNDCSMIMSQAINLGTFLVVSCSREALIPGEPNPGRREAHNKTQPLRSCRSPFIDLSVRSGRHSAVTGNND